MPLLSTLSFHSLSVLINSSSVSAITAKSSAYSSHPPVSTLAKDNWAHWIQAPLAYLQSSHNHPNSYLHNLITVQPPRSTRSSSLVTLARPSTSSSLRITDRSFQYDSPHLGNQLAAPLCQPRTNLSNSASPSCMSGTCSIGSINSPLSSSITP